MNERRKILVAPSSFAELDSEPREKLIQYGFEVINNPFRRKLTSSELKDLLRGAVGLIAGQETIDREVLRESSLRVISRCGVEMSNIDLKAAKELGIIVRNTPDAPTIAVAELTIGAMIGLLRMIPAMNHELHNKKWSKKVGVQLSGKTVVIIGFGRIGRYVARLLRPFDVKLIAVDPALQGIVEQTPVVSLKEALPRADIITLHPSGTSQVLGEHEFSLMKRGVFILNAARGGTIDEDSLLEAITGGKVAGAWIDAFAQEPYSGPLTECPQLILTPHVGSYTRECRKRMEMEAVDNLVSALREASKGGHSQD
jgi:D-3-phosphoglycerate dehydrogenase